MRNSCERAHRDTASGEELPIRTDQGDDLAVPYGDLCEHELISVLD
jgi:hypothetical protein